MHIVAVNCCDDGTPADLALRICLRMLAHRGARLLSRGHGGVVEVPRNGAVTAIAWLDADQIPKLDAAGWLTDIGGDRFILSPTGRAIVRLMKAGPSPAEAGAGASAAPPAPVPLAQTGNAAVDPESPLAWLRARRNKAGARYLSDEAYEAGERLRADFHQAGMMPRLTVNFEAVSRTADERRGMAAKGRSAGGGGTAAQDRVRRALAAVPPELAGLLFDICCIGYRLQEAGRSHGIPQRASHYLIDIALRVLARHYGLLPPADQDWSARRRPRHWGADGYRPSIDGA